MDVKQEKKRIRKELTAVAGRLSEEYCRQADEEIIKRLWAAREYETAETIFCYVGTEREINTIPILVDGLERGKRVGVPRCISPGVMEVRQIQRIEDLEPGCYGIREPGLHCPVLQPGELELAVVPCLSCSGNGVRLGYGGGYYDRYLTAVPAPRFVLCREQLRREDIPKEPHDLVMDLIITECNIIFCRNSQM